MDIKTKDYNCSFQETLSNFLAQARLSVDGRMLALVNLQTRYEVTAKAQQESRVVGFWDLAPWVYESAGGKGRVRKWN